MEKSINFCRLKYFFITLLISFFCFLFSGHKVYAATRTWDGGGATNNWSDCVNWDGPDTCPVAGDTAQFNATSTKNSTVDSTFGGSIGVVSIATTYSGTITLAETLAVTSTYTQSGGTWDSSNQALSIASTFTLNNAGATFKASSGTTTFSSTFSITAGTFTHNSGIVDFSGGAVNLNCNGATFNSVNFTGQTGTKTIGNTSACSFPLGNNPTIPTSITLTNATLSGTGTLTISAGTFTINSASSVLSGFSGLSIAAFTVNNASLTMDLSGYTTFTASGTTTVTAGTLLVPSGTSLAALTVNGGTLTGPSGTMSESGTFTLSSGTFTAPSGVWTLSGAISITGGAFSHNSGSITATGSSSVNWNCNGAIFNSVTISRSGSTLTVGNTSACTLPLGANPSYGGAISLTNGTLSGSGTLTGNNSLTMNAGAVLSGFSGFNITTNGLTVAGATADFSTYTTFVIAGNVTLSSGSLSLPDGADLNGSSSTLALQITGGTFTAPAGTMTLAGGLTISGSPTFNANGGTITIDGGTATLSCNNVTFNLVTFNNDGSTKTVGSNCTLPLGADPILNGSKSVTVNGTLTGSGTLHKPSQTLTLNTGAVLSGFTGLDISSFTVAGATADFSAYSSFNSDAGTVSLSSGSLSLPPTANIDGSLSISGGTFTSASNTLTLAGALTISGSPTFNANGGTIEFDSISTDTTSTNRTLSCNNVTFNLVKLTHTTGSKTVSSDCTLPLGNDPTLNGGGLSLLGGHISGSGTLSTSVYGKSLTFRSDSTITGFDKLIDFNLLVLQSLDLSSFSEVDADGLLLVIPQTATTNLTFIAPPLLKLHDSVYQAYVVGANTSLFYSFNNNMGTIQISPNEETVSPLYFELGTVSLNNLEIESNGFDIPIMFWTDPMTILGTLTIQGTGQHPVLLQLDSFLKGTDKQWSIDAQGPRVLSNIVVSSGKNINSQLMSGENLIDAGNNTGWIFNAMSLNLELDKPGDSSYINENHPTFKWKRATSLIGKRITRYSLRIDNGDTGNWEITDIPPTGSNDVNTSKYTVHYDGFNDSDPNNDYISVYTHESSSWSSTENNGAVKEGLHRWYVTAYDDSDTSVIQTRSVYVDTSPPSVSLTKFGSISISKQFSSIKTSSSHPVLFGKITDAITNEETKDETVASGPKSVLVSISKQVADGRFINLTTTTVPIYDMFLVDTNQKVYSTTYSTQTKYSPFVYTPPYSLTSGTYQVSFSGVDTVGNTGSPTTMTLIISSTVTPPLVTSPSQIFLQPPSRSTAQTSAQIVITPSAKPNPSPTQIPKTNVSSKRCFFFLCF